jgi:hypothetical protein
MPLKATMTAAVFVIAAQIWSVSPTLAEPVTYDLSGTLSDGGTVTGTFTVDGGSLTAYDFTLPTTLPDPVSHEIALTNSFPATSFISLATLPQIQIGNYYDDSGTYFYTVLNLQLNSLPVDSTPTSLGYSSLLQAPLFGSNWDYIGSFQSGTITLADTVAAVPEPSTWAMLLLGFAGVGVMAYRRNLKPKAALMAS